MSTKPLFGLNHMVCPSYTVSEFLDLAGNLKANTVEFRNDVGDNSLTDMATAKQAGEKAQQLGIRVLSINALYPFNVWNDEREHQARELAALAQAAKAEGLVCCPLNDGTPVPFEDLKYALSELAKVLADYDLHGFIEPLGFPISSLRSKRVALEAIDAVGETARFSLVHDTFHHKGAGEEEFFPERTGLVHISGLEDDIRFEDMLDGDRVLVGQKDRLSNVEQLRFLLNAGFTGPVSFEPFSEKVWNLSNIEDAVRDSIQYVNNELA
ncbi:TIM barrel protein [Rhodanobacter aciditrophus]|uniref:TIM barrel protein n=1 Tax=Rhodanobacter aciditrophus TaxID=1623218 RepID=A0ABW4AXQ2_9GAMM